MDNQITCGWPRKLRLKRFFRTLNSGGFAYVKPWLAFPAVGLLLLGAAPAGAATAAYVANYSDTVSVIDTATNSVTAAIPVGDGVRPVSVALRPDGAYAYVTNTYGSSAVSVVDTATNTVSATIPVGGDLQAIAVSPDGRQAYVVVNYDGVAVIDTVTNTVETNLFIIQPTSVAITPDGTRAYVGSREDGGSLVVIDTSTNVVVSSIRFPSGVYGYGGVSGVAIAPDGTLAYVARAYEAETRGYTEGVISVVDTATNTVRATISVGWEAPRSIAVTPDGAYLYVGFDGAVSVIDLCSQAVAAIIPLSGSVRSIAISRDGGFVFVTASDSTDLSVIDRTTNAVVASLHISDGATVGGLDVALTPYGDAAYLTAQAGVFVMDTATHAVTRILAAGGPRGITASPDNSVVYVMNALSNRIAVVDTGTNTVTTSIPVGGSPVAAAFTPDGRFAYVTEYPSSVSVIDTGSRTVLTTIAVGDGPVDVGVTPDGASAYVTLSSDALAVIDTATNTIRATLDLSGVGDYGVGGVAFTPDGRFGYVANADSFNVTVVDAGNLQISGIPVGYQPQDVVIDPKGAFAYVAVADLDDGETHFPHVAVIDTTSNAVVSRIPLTLSSPDGYEIQGNPGAIAMAPDGAAVYVADWGLGRLWIIDTATTAVTATVPIDGSPLGIAIASVPDAAGNRTPFSLPATPAQRSTAAPRPTPTPLPVVPCAPFMLPSATPTAALDVPPSLTGGQFLCSAGSRDGAPCASDHECPAGVCVIAQGVCDSPGGDDDGFPCDCAGGACVDGACRGGASAGRQCDVTFNCANNRPCVGTQQVCLGGESKGFSCLRDAQCPGSTCASTGRFCVPGSDFAGFSCGDAGDCCVTFQCTEAACIGPGSTTPPAAPPPPTPTPTPYAESYPDVRVGSATGMPGDEVTIEVSLGTADATIAGLQNDISFDPSTWIVVNGKATPDCRANPAIDKPATTFAFQPRECTPGSTCTGIRALVLSLDNVDPIPDGALLYTCRLHIDRTAFSGSYPLIISGVAVSSPKGEALPVTGTSGTVIVVGGLEPPARATPSPAPVQGPDSNLPTPRNDAVTIEAPPPQSNGGQLSGVEGAVVPQDGGCSTVPPQRGERAGALILFVPTALLMRWRARSKGSIARRG